MNVLGAKACRQAMTNAGRAEMTAATCSKDLCPAAGRTPRGVVATTQALSGILGDDADLLITAAWLHDIGYSPALAATGFHPLDGARYLRDAEHGSERVCRLAAHHSCAINEAAERGLADALLCELGPPPDDLADALIYCDMTTGPDGQAMAADQSGSDLSGPQDGDTSTRLLGLCSEYRASSETAVTGVLPGFGAHGYGLAGIGPSCTC